MALRSILRPDTSVMVGLANGAIIMAFYQHELPQNAAIRTAEPHDNDIEKSRRNAAWKSAAFLGFMFLLTRDRNAAMIGGLVLASVDITVKHANGLNPETGKLDAASPGDMTIAPDIDNTYPMADYADQIGA